ARGALAHPGRGTRGLCVENRGERGQRDRGDERRPAERRAVTARAERAGDVLASERRPDRYAVGERLGQRHDVGLHTGVLVAPEAPCPSDAGLDLVEDQQRARLVAELAKPRKIVVVRNVPTALTLDRLHYHRTGAVVDRALHRVQVVVGHVLEAGDERLEAVLVLLLPGGGERAHGAAVERIPRGDDLPPIRGHAFLAILARQLDGRLVGLGPGVGEKHAVGERLLAQQLGQADLGGRVIEVRQLEPARRN